MKMCDYVLKCQVVSKNLTVGKIYNYYKNFDNAYKKWYVFGDNGMKMSISDEMLEKLFKKVSVKG